MFRKDLPVVEELISLLKLISYTGALTFVPYGHGTALAPMGKRLLRSIQQLMMTVVFLLLLVMSVFQLAQLALVLWRMNGVGELMPMIIWVTFFPLALMSSRLPAAHLSSVRKKHGAALRQGVRPAVIGQRI